MCNRQQRSRLGHPVTSEHIDAALHRLLGERLRKGGPSDHHLQAGKIDVGLRGCVKEHLQERRHAMGKRHAFRLDQPDEQRRIVAAGIDLLDAGKRGRPREAPRVNMEHGRDRHIDVVAMEARLASPQGQTRRVPPWHEAPTDGGCSRRLSAAPWFLWYRRSSPARSRRSQGSQSPETQPRAAPHIRRRIQVCWSPALCGR